MRLRTFSPCLLALAVFAIANYGIVANGQPLLIDFNSLTQDGGPHPTEGYQSYDAGHEVAADFDTKIYEAFGTEVALTPGWPDSTDPNTKQMIDRTSGHDDHWHGDKVDLLTDWLGVDARTGNGGNGDFTLEDGGDFTRLTLTLAGLPAGSYNWVSYHHDTEYIHTDFLMEFSLDGGGGFDFVTDVNGNGLFTMTSSNDSGGDNPPADEHYKGDDDPDPILLPSTVIWEFDKPTDDDLLVRYTPLAHTAVHTQLVGINGFELYQVDPLPPVGGDFDDDGTYSCSDIDLLYGALDSGDAAFDLNEDGTVNGGDVTAWLEEAGPALGYSGAIKPGDADLDGVVTAADLNTVGVNWLKDDVTSWCAGDFNHDGSVTASDLNDLGVNWLSDIRQPAAAASVPEPTSLFLAAVALVLLVIRRRR